MKVGDVILLDETDCSEAGSRKGKTVSRIEIVVGLGVRSAWRKKGWICACDFGARKERIGIEGRTVNYSDATIAPNRLLNNFRCVFRIFFKFLSISLDIKANSLACK